MNGIASKTYDKQTPSKLLYLNFDDFQSHQIVSAKYGCCGFPHLTIKSITFWYLIILITMLVVSQILFYVKVGEFDVQKDAAAWNCVLYNLGSYTTSSIHNDYEFFRLVTYSLLHAGVVHLVFNCIPLFLIGFLIEHIQGKCSYFFLLLFSTILSAMLEGLFTEVTLVGASGAIYGLFGFFLVYNLFNYPILEKREKKAFFFILLCIIASFFFQIFQNAQANEETKVAVLAHLGGLITGTALGSCYIDLKENHHFFSQRTLRSLGVARLLTKLILALSFIGMGACILFKEVPASNPCVQPS